MSRTEEPRRRSLAAAKALPRPELVLSGIAVGEGIAIGPVFGAAEPPLAVTRRRIAASDIEAETVRLDAAVAQSQRQLAKLRARLSVLPEQSQAEIAPLIDAYLQMLKASRLLRGVSRRIADGLVSAETAIADESESLAGAIMSQKTAAPDEDHASLQRRADEVREIARRLIRNLGNVPFRSFAGLPDGSVLVCEYLRPADAALLDPARVAGVATDEGGADGHAAIMLRALGIPAVLGATGLSGAVRPGMLAVIDGSAGTVALNPSAATLARARREVTAYARTRQSLGRLRRLPAVTTDGETIELQANLELPAELPLIAQAGGFGIGLLRSEFLFMNREKLPSETVQADAYRSVIEAMAGDPVTIRVLDWGGEKEIEAIAAEGLVPQFADDNPALGLRGIRLLLRQPDLFETQIAAILRAASRASGGGRVRILLPMVTAIAELRGAREVYERVIRRMRRRSERLPQPLPPIGVMIETPGAALAADALALEADFFAIGTNDLAMYTLAVDRGAADVAHLYDPLHPAVLRLIQFSVEAALRLRRPVSVCGEMAANPRYAPLLLGLGLRSFSMNAGAIPRVKRAIRAVAIEECVRLARRVMECADPERITALVAEVMPG